MKRSIVSGYEFWLKPRGLNVGYSVRFPTRTAAVAYRDAGGMSAKHYSIRMWRVYRDSTTCAVVEASTNDRSTLPGSGPGVWYFTPARGEHRL